MKRRHNWRYALDTQSEVFDALGVRENTVFRCVNGFLLPVWFDFNVKRKMPIALDPKLEEYLVEKQTKVYKKCPEILVRTLSEFTEDFPRHFPGSTGYLLEEENNPWFDDCFHSNHNKSNVWEEENARFPLRLIRKKFLYAPNDPDNKRYRLNQYVIKVETLFEKHGNPFVPN